MLLLAIFFKWCCKGTHFFFFFLIIIGKKKKKLETFVCRFRVKGTVGLEPTVIIFPPICLTNDIDVHWRKVANSLTDGFHLGNGR